jgi:2-polyprenyl-6-methoxyphenol hydroxylase-like FAD-dependent oxidoreductase
MRVLIIGGVAGGMSTATRLTRLDETASITVIERSGHVSYANLRAPLLRGRNLGSLLCNLGSLQLGLLCNLGKWPRLDSSSRFSEDHFIRVSHLDRLLLCPDFYGQFECHSGMLQFISWI